MDSADKEKLDKLWDVAYSFEQKGNFDEAQKWFQLRLDTCRRVFGEDHTETYRAISSVAGVLAKKGEFSRAKSMFEQAVKGLTKHCGKDDPHAKIAQIGLIIATNQIGFVSVENTGISQKVESPKPSSIKFRIMSLLGIRK